MSVEKSVCLQLFLELFIKEFWVELEACDSPLRIYFFKGDFQEAKSNEVLRFFTNIPIMKDWGTASVSAVIRGVVLRTFNKGDELYKEDDRANCVYIVKEGEIEVL